MTRKRKRWRPGGGGCILSALLVWAAAGCASVVPPSEPSARDRVETTAGTPARAAPRGHVRVSEAPVKVLAVDAATPADPSMEALVGPFREVFEAEMSEEIGHAVGRLEEADPEGGLDNFAADAVLEGARRFTDRPIHVALLNDGGLRAPIGQGPITLGEMFELMPFENYVTILELSGTEIELLAQQLARTGGEPVAGLRFRINAPDGSATDVRVSDQPLDPAATYRLATSDYLADGGGSWPVLWEPRAREDLPVLIRDLLIDWVRRQGTIQPALDGRIRRGGGDAECSPETRGAATEERGGR